jgi:hypothetical protein
MAAGLFGLIGSSVVALKVIPIALHALGAWLLWRLGRHTVGNRAGQVGALAFWLYPGIYVWWSTKEGAFYGATLVLGLLLLLLTIRFAERPTYPDSFGLGLALGSGIWASPQIVYYAVPAALWLVFRRGRWLASTAWRAVSYGSHAFLGLLVGVAPWLGYNAFRNWASVRFALEQLHTPHSGAHTYGWNLRAFFRIALPVALGLRHPYSFRWAIPLLGAALYVVLIASFAWSLTRGEAATSPLKVLVVLYPVLFALTPQFGSTTFEPRFVYFLVPIVLLLAGAAFRRAPTAVLTLLTAVSIVGLGSLNSWARATPTHYDIDSIAPRDMHPLISELERRRVRYVFAPYRYAYRVPFESRERIIASPLDFVRYEPLDRAMRRSASPSYVFLRGGLGDRTFGSFVRSHRAQYTRIRAGDYAVYLMKVKLFPEDVPGIQPFGIH